MEVMSFVVKDLLILTVALNVLGIALKKTSMISDKYIPVILLPLALVASCLMLGQFDVNSIIQGILTWGVSIGIHQTTIVQPKK